MNFKYCRAYSWPYDKDRQKISKVYFDKMIKESKKLSLKLPCNFVIFLAYEQEEFPFTVIALDIDYHSVANSEICQILDKQLGEPKSSSVENPSWFSSAVDSNYRSTLASCGVTIIDGSFYEGTGELLVEESGNGPRVIHVEPSMDDINRRVAEVLGDSTFSEINPDEEITEESLEWQLCDAAGQNDNNEKVYEVSRLISKGADVNSPRDTHPSSEQDTPLICAAYSGYLDTVKILLSHGANIDKTNRGGQTALMRAAAYNRKEVVIELINAGADLRMKWGEDTALDIAENNSHHEIATLLKNAMNKRIYNVLLIVAFIAILLIIMDQFL